MAQISLMHSFYKTLLHMNHTEDNITYEQILLQLRKKYDGESLNISVLHNEMSEALENKQRGELSLIRHKIRTCENHKRMISRILGSVETLMLSSGN